MKLGTPEIILILVIVVIVFGVGKLPQVASALGKSIKAFKDGQKDADKEEIAEAKEDKKEAAVKEDAAVDTTAEVVKNEPVGPVENTTSDGE